ncbi:hypothetical protein D9M68_615520 [compost metagenome]
MLKQNYPNPANTLTHIPFILPEKADTRLILSNAQGKVIATLVNSTLNAGTYAIPVDVKWLSSGLYFYELRAGHYRKSLKMLVVK